MLPDTQSYAALAGELEDYAAVEDPTTDLPAEASDETRCDVAQMTRTAMRAYVAFRYTGGVVVIDEHDAVWGNSEAVKPAVVRNGMGDYTITWPASVNDERGIAHSLNLKVGWGTVETAAYHAYPKRVTPNEFDVPILDMSASAVADPGDRCIVFVR